MNNIKINKMRASKASALIAGFLMVSKNRFGARREIDWGQWCKTLAEAAGRIIAFN